MNIFFKFVIVVVFGTIASTARAQPQVTLEFEKSIGQFWAYEIINFEPNSVPPEGFNHPTGVDWLSGRDFVVADNRNNKLQTCNDEGECKLVGGDPFIGGRNDPGLFDHPHGVEVNIIGRIAVADEENNAVQYCTYNGSCVYSGESLSNNNPPSSSLGKWDNPDDVAFDSDQNIHGLDTGNDRVQVLRNGDLNVLGVYMSSGSGVGQINGARGIAIDKDDNVIIADTGNNRVQICDIDENCSVFGSMGSATGQFNAPSGVDVDTFGRIWVADTGNSRIQVCDYDGLCVAFGQAGSGDFEFDGLFDVAVHPTGRVAVADANNNRIQLFRTEGSFSINPGMNDAWYNKATDGQGFFITVFPDLGLVSLAWFTYETEIVPNTANLGYSGHRWLTALGPFSGKTATLNIDIASGGIFDTATDISHRSDGTIILTFESCNSGTVEYNIPSINQQGTVPITRVADDNVALCNAFISQ